MDALWPQKERFAVALIGGVRQLFSPPLSLVW